jgi:two-component system cell cycle sensor histidine kinase/response regulator CckA
MAIILVVDGEPAIRALIACALEQKGFPVLTSGDGLSAISISRSCRGEIGLLITDVGMPQMDGPTLARALLAEDPDLPILFISAHHNPAGLDQFESAEFLAKPFSLDVLLSKVRALTRQTSLQTVT